MPTWNVPLIVNTTNYSTPVVNGLLGMITLTQNGTSYSGSILYLKPRQLANQTFPLSPVTNTNGTLTMTTPGAAGTNGVSDPNWNRSEPQYTFTATLDAASNIVGGDAWLPVNLIAAMRSLTNGVEGYNFSGNPAVTFGSPQRIIAGNDTYTCTYIPSEKAWMLPSGNGEIDIYTNAFSQPFALTLGLKAAAAGADFQVTLVGSSSSRVVPLSPGTSAFATQSLLVPVGTMPASGQGTIRLQNIGPCAVYIKIATFAY